jgi:hypothetical protein
VDESECKATGRIDRVTSILCIAGCVGMVTVDYRDITVTNSLLELAAALHTIRETQSRSKS